MKILFIGGSGMLGKPVTHELVKQGFDLSLLARDPSRMEKIYPGKNIIPGDVFDKQSLLEAMKKTDTVYCNLSVLQTSKEKDPQMEREGLKNIIAAAKETGIKRIIYLSSLVHRYEGMNGFNWWAFRIKRAAVERVKTSGIPYTIFYPSTFMETYPYQMLRGNKVAMLGRSVAPMWFIAAEDYARQVARSLESTGEDNREYPVQGPAAYTFSEATKIFTANYSKKKLTTLQAPIGLVKFLGNFSQRMNYGWHICEALNKYPEKFESETTWKQLGTPTTSLADYAGSL